MFRTSFREGPSNTIMPTRHADDPLAQLLWLGHEIGREDRGLALPGEGSVSVRLGEGRFGVRCSGTALHELTKADICQCDSKEIISFIDSQGSDTSDLQAALIKTVPTGAPRPTTESLFHAWLLQLEGVHFVGHCHPEACLQILCSPVADRFADHRMFPDEILNCGPQSTLVPYLEPGAQLARELRAKVNIYIRRNFGRPPRLILLQNHGIIALGETAKGVLNTLLMAEKAARIFVGAAQLGGPNFMTPAMVTRIDNPGRTRR